jgi:lactose/raffinose/galactose permease
MKQNDILLNGNFIVFRKVFIYYLNKDKFALTYHFILMKGWYKMKEDRLSKVQLAAYSFGAFGNNAFYGLLSGYLIMFITSHLINTNNESLKNQMIGTITLVIMLLRIVELFIDPFIGNAIDRTKTRWGHFRPWVVAGGTISSILLLTLFTDMGGLYKKNAMFYLVIFAAIYILMDIFYSFKDVAFWSMLPSLTTDSRKREKIATFAQIFSIIAGGLLGVVVMPAVLFFSKTTTASGDNRGWFVFALIVCLISLVSSLAVGIWTKEVNSDIRKNKEDTVGVTKVFKAVVKNDQLFWIACTYLFYGIAVNILSSLELYYFTYVMGQPKSFSILATINMVLGMLSASLFPAASKKFNRRLLFVGCLICMIIAIGLFSVAGNSLPLVILAAVMFALPTNMVFLVVLMIITDSVEYGQLKLGHRDESLSLSIRPLIDKFGGAISNGVVGQVAIIAGMTTGATASSMTRSGILHFKLIMFAIPAVMLIISMFIFIKKVTLTEEKHAEIVAELEKTWAQKKINNENKRVINKISLSSPVSGRLMELNQVNDETFSSQTIGKGFAISPTDGTVISPFNGIVSQVFSTRHALGITSEDGVILLIHIGFGTVGLKGEGFTSYVVEGQSVKKGELLIEFNDSLIKQHGLDDTVVVMITNIRDFENFELLKSNGSFVELGEDTMVLN